MCDAVRRRGRHAVAGRHSPARAPVGDRLAVAAFNSVYGGTAASDWPYAFWLRCRRERDVPTIEFNTTLLRGDTIMLNPHNSSLNNEIAPPLPLPAGLEQCYSVTKSVCASHLRNYNDCRACKEDPVAWAKLSPPAVAGRSITSMKPVRVFSHRHPATWLARRGVSRPGWRGWLGSFLHRAGSGWHVSSCRPVGAGYNPGAGKWVTVDILSAGASGVTVDLGSGANGTAPAAVRYSWGSSSAATRVTLRCM